MHGSAVTHSGEDTSRPPIVLRVTAILCWFCGGGIGLSGLVLFVATLAIGSFSLGATMLALALVATGIGYCVAGYLIRKKRMAGMWIGLACATLVSIVEMRGRTTATGIVLAVNLVILVLLIVNWRRFRPRVG
jgi:hypothetical protein